MSIRLEMRAEPGLLRADAAGEFSLEEAKRTFLEILEAVAKHKTKKVLFDGRALMGEPETLERFLYGEFVAKSVVEFEDRGVSRATKFAYVLEQPMLDPRRFGETVAVNRGMLVEIFDNLDGALRWLRAESANKTDAGGPQRFEPDPKQ